MSDKTERWAFARIRELEQERRALRERVRRLAASRDLWKLRALRKTVKR